MIEKALDQPEISEGIMEKIFKPKVKILIIGHKRHGKDTVAELLQEMFNVRFKSSSMAASEIFIFDKLKDKYGYKTADECFKDRIHHRSEWYDLISDYNKTDPARLAKEIISNNDCYVGMRSPIEYLECMRLQLFDLVIWVDAKERLPLEERSSMRMTKSMADIIIDNNDDDPNLQLLRGRLYRLGKTIFNFV